MARSPNCIVILLPNGPISIRRRCGSIGRLYEQGWRLTITGDGITFPGRIYAEYVLYSGKLYPLPDELREKFFVENLFVPIDSSIHDVTGIGFFPHVERVMGAIHPMSVSATWVECSSSGFSISSEPEDDQRPLDVRQRSDRGHQLSYRPYVRQIL
jgi:hypothetical protein